MHLNEWSRGSKPRYPLPRAWNCTLCSPWRPLPVLSWLQPPLLDYKGQIPPVLKITPKESFECILCILFCHWILFAGFLQVVACSDFFSHYFVILIVFHSLLPRTMIFFFHEKISAKSKLRNILQILLKTLGTHVHAFTLDMSIRVELMFIRLAYI